VSGREQAGYGVGIKRTSEKNRPVLACAKAVEDYRARGATLFIETVQNSAASAFMTARSFELVRSLDDRTPTFAVCG